MSKHLPPSGPVRWAIQGIDGLLRRYYGVVPFSNHHDCLFRISPGTSDVDMLLSDGTQVHKGDPVLDLHLWNERLASLLLPWTDLARGRALLRHIIISLRLLSGWYRSPSNQGSFVALRAEFGMVAEIRQVEAILRRFGFDTVVKERPGFRIWRRAFWDNVFSMALMWTFNPEFARTRCLTQLSRTRAWISLERLHERFAI